MSNIEVRSSEEPALDPVQIQDHEIRVESSPPTFEHTIQPPKLLVQETEHETRASNPELAAAVTPSKRRTVVDETPETNRHMDLSTALFHPLALFNGARVSSPLEEKAEKARSAHLSLTSKPFTVIDSNPWISFETIYNKSRKRLSPLKVSFASRAGEDEDDSIVASQSAPFSTAQQEQMNFETSAMKRKNPPQERTSSPKRLQLDSTALSVTPSSTKRGRGRPRKIIDDSRDPSITPSTSAKRGRGRPRKSDVIPSSAGEPSQLVSLPSQPHDALSQNTPTRKRGRPRKVESPLKSSLLGIVSSPIQQGWTPINVSQKEAKPSTQKSKVQTPAQKPTQTKSEGPFHVLFASSSSFGKYPKIKTFFIRNGGKEVTDVKKDWSMLVVGHSELQRTPKVMIAIALGRPIITDSWLSESSKAGSMLEPANFFPEKAKVSDGLKEWEPADLASRQGLLAGWTAILTPAFKRDCTTKRVFSDLSYLFNALSVDVLKSIPARDIKTGELPPMTIIFGLDSGDTDCINLMENEFPVYGIDFIGVSILRNRLDLESDEFRIKLKRGRR